MKFPSERTCAYAILEAIHLRGALTKGQLVRLLDGRFVRQTTEDKILELLTLNQLILVDDGLNISSLVRRHFDQCELDKQEPEPLTTSVATHRTAKPFTPLKNYKLDREGMRPGSNDFRSWKSRHLP